jgi:hypothetical protein
LTRDFTLLRSQKAGAIRRASPARNRKHEMMFGQDKGNRNIPNQSDKGIIRELASRLAEIAALPG